MFIKVCWKIMKMEKTQHVKKLFHFIKLLLPKDIIESDGYCRLGTLYNKTMTSMYCKI